MSAVAGPARIPDAFLALVAAVEEANPHVSPVQRGFLLRVELEREGWHVGVPGSCRPVRVGGAAS